MSIVKNNQVETYMRSPQNIIGLIVRSAFLGAIVYAATTHIPAREIAPQTRVIIAVIVVILYNFMEYFSGFLRSIRKFLCVALCGCEPGAVGGLGSWGSDISDVIPPDIPPSRIKGSFDSEQLASEVEAALRDDDPSSPITTNAPALTLGRTEPGPPAETEEEGALKASGCEFEDDEAPSPAETTEGFVDYASV